MPIEARVYLVVVGVLGVVVFVLYALDKRAAVKGRARTTEGTLHLLELMGGWVGAMIARRLLRHKSRKVSFRVVSWLIVVAHVGLMVGWWWMRYGR
ncbi:MAG: DUF1294 domain-containing protein [Phycisphaeraceae bacterium]